MLNIPLVLRVSVIAGSLVYLGLILILLRKKKLNVQYSIIWLASGFVFLVFATFPYLVALLSTFFRIEMPANLVFTLIFVFVLLLLLSLSTIVTGFAARIKHMAQTQALLEERIRRLEGGQTESGALQPAPDEKTGQAPGEENGGLWP